METNPKMKKNKLPGNPASVGTFSNILFFIFRNQLVEYHPQVWFVGPIAKKSGDLGFETGFVVCFLLYVPLRLLEKKFIR